MRSPAPAPPRPPLWHAASQRRSARRALTSWAALRSADDLDAPLLKLTDGFRRFREETVATNREKYSALAKVQNPKARAPQDLQRRRAPEGARPGRSAFI